MLVYKPLAALPPGALPTDGPHRFATEEDPTSLMTYALGDRRFEVHKRFRLADDGRLGSEESTSVVEVIAETADQVAERLQDRVVEPARAIAGNGDAGTYLASTLLQVVGSFYAGPEWAQRMVDAVDAEGKLFRDFAGVGTDGQKVQG